MKTISVCKSIIDNELGKRWDIIKHEENRYDIKYYEFYKQIGWRLLFTDRNYTKEAIEFEFDICLG